MNNLYGITVPVITPFGEGGELDLQSLESLTEYVIRSGLHCLYPCGTTGEMLLLSIEERKQIVETVIKTTDHRVPVFVQAGAMNPKDTLALARHAYEVGADGIGVVTPAFFKLSDRELIEYYGEVADSIPEDFSMYLYAIPQNAVNDINPMVAEEIARAHKNVAGIKYSFPDLSRIQQFMLINDGTFSVLVGSDELFEAAVAVGGAGTVSGNSMIIPEHYLALWNAMQQNDFELATRYQRRTNELNSILCAKNNIAAYKIMLREEGVIQSSAMRPPMTTLGMEDEKELIQALSEKKYKEVII
ncbi:MAG: dihydrodipicolinate synthase family protein [Clostridiales Family XIII bacterium]|jgi:4-hydroxy-tetrahydrodipicolinate synthase|nr:dihydrodipicolinate synthase family protein [Clostridiales Family XIII bacterium]